MEFGTDVRLAGSSPKDSWSTKVEQLGDDKLVRELGGTVFVMEVNSADIQNYFLVAEGDVVQC